MARPNELLSNQPMVTPLPNKFLQMATLLIYMLKVADSHLDMDTD
jgi:hypothetical protein